MYGIFIEIKKTGSEARKYINPRIKQKELLTSPQSHRDTFKLVKRQLSYTDTEDTIITQKSESHKNVKARGLSMSFNIIIFNYLLAKF